MSYETDPSEEYNSFSLSQFEGFDQGDEITKLKLLLSAETYANITSDLNLMTFPEERRSMFNACMQYALLSTQIDGFRVQKGNYVVSTILPDTLRSAQDKLLRSTPDQARIVHIDLHNEQANTLKQIAENNSCLMGDVLTIGADIRREVKQQYEAGNRIIAVMANSDKRLEILPVS